MQEQQAEVAEWELIIKRQGNGYSIGLPLAYIRALKLVPGNYVRLQILPDGSLKVTPKKLIQ
jgi:antitoxin component of MazEF toxin-antitoxin module